MRPGEGEGARVISPVQNEPNAGPAQVAAQALAVPVDAGDRAVRAGVAAPTERTQRAAARGLGRRRGAGRVRRLVYRESLT